MLRYRDLRSAPGMVLGQMLNHVGIPTTSDTCSRAVEEAWAARSELRFQQRRGEQGRHIFFPAASGAAGRHVVVPSRFALLEQ